MAEGKEKKPLDRDTMYQEFGTDPVGDFIDGAGSGFLAGTTVGYIYQVTKVAATSPSSKLTAGLRAASTKSVRFGGVCAIFSALDMAAKYAFHNRVQQQRNLSYSENVGISTALAGAMVAPRYGFARASLATTFGFLPFFAELNASELYPEDAYLRLRLSRSNTEAPAPAPAPASAPLTE